MAQSGYTPLLVYGSSTAAAEPTAGNLTSSSNGAELALNYADGKLFYKNSGGNVRLLAVGYGSSTVTPTAGGVQYGTGSAVAFTAAGTAGYLLQSNGSSAPTWVAAPSTSPGGSNTQVQFNNSGAFGGSSLFTWDGAQIQVNGVRVGRGAGAVASNTAVGASALNTSNTGPKTTAIGYQALYSYNGSVGYNTAVGTESLYANTSGYDNVAMGVRALWSNTTGIGNTASGNAALYLNTTGTQNSAFGYNALNTNSTGSYNTAVGKDALVFNTTASNNTAVGYQAGYSNTTGDRNTYIGRLAGYTTTTSGLNTAVGESALYLNVTGTENTAIGQEALRVNTASYNTSVGRASLYSNTSGANNTAHGYMALFSNTTASYNTSVGYQAGYANTTANYATYLGASAGLDVTTGAGNCFVGAFTGQNVTTGSANTFVGGLVVGSSNGCGSEMTTGSKNTILGGYTGNQGGLDIRTASNYVVLSDGDGNPRMYFDANGIANLRSSMLEQMTISATAATGTINFDAITQSVLYYTTNASGNFTMNVRGSSTVTLNNSMVTGQSLTIAFLCTNGATAYYQTAMTIDGTSVTPKWQGGTAPSAGNASSIDSYVYTIIKTAASTFTVLASQTKFA